MPSWMLQKGFSNEDIKLGMKYFDWEKKKETFPDTGKGKGDYSEAL